MRGVTNIFLNPVNCSNVGFISTINELSTVCSYCLKITFLEHLS